MNVVDDFDRKRNSGSFISLVPTRTPLPQPSESANEKIIIGGSHAESEISNIVRIGQVFPSVHW
jgi:hypothetical protein